MQQTESDLSRPMSSLLARTERDEDARIASDVLADSGKKTAARTVGQQCQFVSMLACHSCCRLFWIAYNLLVYTS